MRRSRQIVNQTNTQTKARYKKWNILTIFSKKTSTLHLNHSMAAIIWVRGLERVTNLTTLQESLRSWLLNKISLTNLTITTWFKKNAPLLKVSNHQAQESQKLSYTTLQVNVVAWNLRTMWKRQSKNLPVNKQRLLDKRMNLLHLNKSSQRLKTRHISGLTSMKHCHS